MVIRRRTRLSSDTSIMESKRNGQMYLLHQMKAEMADKKLSNGYSEEFVENYKCIMNVLESNLLDNIQVMVNSIKGMSMKDPRSTVNNR
jgi:hypothetical protein